MLTGIPAALLIATLLLMSLGCEDKSPAPTVSDHPSDVHEIPSQAAAGSGSEDDPTYRRRSGFVPLDNPVFLSSGDASYLDDDELVLGVFWQGAARAYAIRMITFHHIVNDNVAGRPILVTY